MDYATIEEQAGAAQWALIAYWKYTDPDGLKGLNPEGRIGEKALAARWFMTALAHWIEEEAPANVSGVLAARSLFRDARNDYDTERNDAAKAEAGA